MKLKLGFFGTPDFSADQPPTPEVEEERSDGKTSGVI